MSFAAVQKFVPLLGLFGKPAGELQDSDLAVISQALSEDSQETVTELFALLKRNEPATLVKNLLGSRTVKSMVESAQGKKQEAEKSIFCKCPACEVSFETEINM